VKGLKLGLGG